MCVCVSTRELAIHRVDGLNFQRPWGQNTAKKNNGDSARVVLVMEHDGMPVWRVLAVGTIHLNVFALDIVEKESYHYRRVSNTEIRNDM